MAIGAAIGKKVTYHSRLIQSLWCVVAAFGAYFCMYAFRKPFTVGLFSEGQESTFKTLLVAAQVFGYTLSKFVGIKVIAEMPAPRRIAVLVGLVITAELALVLFAIVPRPWNAACMFLNGVPLGMVFGLVLSFLEGREHSEALAAGLCASFIVADGAVKTAGAYVLNWCDEYWMPSVTGLLFLFPFLMFAAMLARVPPPTAADRESRCERGPMDHEDRLALFLRYAAGLSLVGIVYLLVTILRSVRADFAREIWIGMGVEGAPIVFASSETIVGLAMLLPFGLAILIRDHRVVFFASIGVSIAGLTLIAVATMAFRLDFISPMAFMILNGVGLYLPYVAVHTTLFERLLAATRERGNVGFLMYLVDSVGYLGYVAVMLARIVLGNTGNMLPFFISASFLISCIGIPLLILAWRNFGRHPALMRSPA